MAYKFFDKQFLVMPDEKDIIGKKVFYADHFDALVCDVESGDLNKAGKLDVIFTGSSFPFYINNSHWNLAYHDPNYECKVAYSQGKKIQYKTSDGEWVDAVPHWVAEGEYRVKPDTWYVHQDIDGHYWKSDSATITVEFEGTEAECDKWIEEHTLKTRRMTNRELMRWLAEGKGEKVDVVTEYVSLYYSYEKGMDDEECDKDTRIRAWDSDEWYEPLVEVNE